MNVAILKRELKGNLKFILVFIILGVVSGTNAKEIFTNSLDSPGSMGVLLTLSMLPFMAFLMHLSQTYLRDYEDGRVAIPLNSPNSRADIFISKFVSSLVISLIIYFFVATIKSAIWIGRSSEIFFSNPDIQANYWIFLFHSFYLFVLLLLFIGGLVALIYQLTCTSKLGIALSVAYPIGSLIYEVFYIQLLVQGDEFPLIVKTLRFVFYQFFFTPQFLSQNYLDLGFNWIITHILGPALGMLFFLVGIVLFSKKDIKF